MNRALAPWDDKNAKWCGVIWLTHLKGQPLIIGRYQTIGFFFCKIWLTWTHRLHARCNIRKRAPDVLNNYDPGFEFAQRSQECESRSAAVWLLFSSAPFSAFPPWSLPPWLYLCGGLASQTLAYGNVVVRSCNCLLVSRMCALFLSLGYSEGRTDTTCFTPGVDRSACYIC